MSKSEAEVEAEIKIYGPSIGCQLMRNNSGAFYNESSQRQIRYGLGSVSKKHDEKIKSSDEIGFTKIVITQEMVGKTVAVFTAIEVKESGWIKPKDPRERAQEAFIDWIKTNGGIAGFASSIDSFMVIIKNYYFWLRG